MMLLDNVEMPPLSFLTRIAQELRRVMKLNLFNFDVIRDSTPVLLTFLCDGLCKKQQSGESEECLKDAIRIVNGTGCGDRDEGAIEVSLYLEDKESSLQL